VFAHLSHLVADNQQLLPPDSQVSPDLLWPLRPPVARSIVPHWAGAGSVNLHIWTAFSVVVLALAAHLLVVDPKTQVELWSWRQQGPRLAWPEQRPVRIDVVSEPLHKPIFREQCEFDISRARILGNGTRLVECTVFISGSSGSRCEASRHHGISSISRTPPRNSACSAC